MLARSPGNRKAIKTACWSFQEEVTERQEQIKEGRAYFGSQFQGTTALMMERAWQPGGLQHVAESRSHWGYVGMIKKDSGEV